MSSSEQSVKAPSAFIHIKTADTAEAMNAFSPHELEEGSRYIPTAEHPKQRWMGLILGEEETTLLQQILELGESSSVGELRDFAKRMNNLVRGGLIVHQENLANAS